MSCSAYAAVRSCFQCVLACRDALPGMVTSLQTFGSLGNWHPPVHVLVTDGLAGRGGNSVLLGVLDAFVVTERFWRLLLWRLPRAERLSARFLEALLA